MSALKDTKIIKDEQVMIKILLLKINLSVFILKNPLRELIYLFDFFNVEKLNKVRMAKTKNKIYKLQPSSK